LVIAATPFLASSGVVVTVLPLPPFLNRLGRDQIAHPL